ncbi:MAG: DUF2070 family protein [Methanosphaera sp.]|uniref:DUF2070 family protein n=1 Tax=Methanosphaera sp. TaxID=2666342 RepID=UPI0025E15C22|nr:DUF2070 family protein [Methanosphaera sp.]MCI5867092.1 DUF2070 family protein [Methanosphaera sp.]MDD6535202.1 DUF2070 family protein [Methanosphaera sp.]MDY3956522.1 DUF2070 family protein [Methanosphaera sp.]
MAISDRVVALSKYMVSLPKTNMSVFLILVFSFLSGSIADCIMPGIPLSGIVYTFISGGATGFFLFGLPAIISGGLIHSITNSLKKRHMKLKQAMFLSFVAMMFLCIFYDLAAVVSLFIDISLISVIILGILFMFAVEALILWATSNIKYYQGVLIAAIQPLITLSMFIVVIYLQVTVSKAVVLSLYFKAIIGAILLAIAIYSFVAIIESPIKGNLGVGGLELLSLFIAQISEGSNALESVFDDMGEEVDTTVGLISFKDKNGNIKANYISPCIHPGPVGSIGGGNLPTVIAEALDDFTIIAHGAATHDFNPVAESELKKVIAKINEALPNLEYSDEASVFQRVQYDDAKIGIQFFDEGCIELVTFAPNIGDDIDYGVGLSIMYKTKFKTDVRDVVFVDCHNCLDGNYERLLAGHNRVLQLENAVDSIEKPSMHKIMMGCSFDPVREIVAKDGIGDSGIKVMITKVDSQLMAYLVYDGNNMKQHFREEIFEKVKEAYPEIDMMEAMTTDTHIVNTISGGGVTVGSRHSDILIEKTLKLVGEALDDLEEVSVASDTIHVNLKTLGPNHTTELVTTIASVVSVSKLLAPVLFIAAVILVIIWIF